MPLPNPSPTPTPGRMIPPGRGPEPAWMADYQEYLRMRQALPPAEEMFGVAEVDPAFVAYDTGAMSLPGFGGQERLEQVGQGFVPQRRIRPPMESGPVQYDVDALDRAEAQRRFLARME